MIQFKFHFIYLILIIGSLVLTINHILTLRQPYSFFIAGHVYGSPGRIAPGVCPPFKSKFKLINQNEHMAFGVLTGDIVKESTKEEWDAVENDLDYLNCPVYYAFGSHDYTNIALIESRFERTYFDFIINRDLHIILDPNIDNWNISGEQLSFLKKTISKNSAKVVNVFIYFHQVLWWAQHDSLVDIRLNSLEGRSPEMNFGSEVLPLFYDIDNPIYLFAGDVGAAYWSDDCSYDKIDNIHFISSGMGEGAGDNFLIANVDKSGTVFFDLISLNTESTNDMGSIEDY